MAVKAIGTIWGVHWQSATLFNIDVAYCGMTPQDVSGNYNVVDIPATLNDAQFKAFVEDAVKAYITSEHGVTFEPSDTVRLLGVA